MEREWGRAGGDESGKGEREFRRGGERGGRDDEGVVRCGGGW